MLKREGRSSALLRPEELSKPDVSRRAALRGAAAVATAAIAIGVMASTPAQASPVHPNDARLIDLADTAMEALERACDAYTADHRGQRDRRQRGGLRRALPRLRPSSSRRSPRRRPHTMVGRPRQGPGRPGPGPARGFGDCSRSGCRLADDVWRLFGGGAA